MGFTDSPTLQTLLDAAFESTPFARRRRRARGVLERRGALRYATDGARRAA